VDGTGTREGRPRGALSLRVAEWLAVPGMMAGSGAAVFWVAQTAYDAGVAFPEAAVLPVVLAAVVAGWGAVFAPPFTLASLLIMGTVRCRLGPTPAYRKSLGLVALSLLGTALAWTVVPHLL
jgi:hypothetical protein